MLCGKCKVELVMETTLFSYMGYSFSEAMPRCPKCGLVYIPEEIVSGKMREVEIQLEDK